MRPGLTVSFAPKPPKLKVMDLARDRHMATHLARMRLELLCCDLDELERCVEAGAIVPGVYVVGLDLSNPMAPRGDLCVRMDEITIHVVLPDGVEGPW